MKIFKKTLGFASFVVLGLASVQGVQAQEIKIDNNSGLLYEISGNGLKKPSYLFGTVHLICPDDMISIDKLEPYVSGSDQLMLELDFDDPSELKALMALMTPAKTENLAEHLTKAQFDKIDKMTKSYLGKPFAELQNLNPVILESMLLTSSKGIGCSPPGSYEITFFLAAAKKGMSIEGLETVADQMAALKKTAKKKHAEMIYEIAMDPDKYFGQFRDLIKVYKSQDSEALYVFVQESMSKDPAMQVNLLDDRNKNWVPKIEKTITGTPTFIAVGAAHLGGENGILKLLREKGFEVKAIRL